MLVRQLVGSDAGKVLDMPYHVARAKVMDGSGAWPDDGKLAEPEGPTISEQQPPERKKLTLPNKRR